MNKKEITINGVNYPVVFTMDTIIKFEFITKQAFFDEELDLRTLISRTGLIMAAVLTANKDAKLTVDELNGKRDLKAVQQIITAHGIVADLMNEFFETSEFIKKAEEAEKNESEENGDNAKN